MTRVGGRLALLLVAVLVLTAGVGFGVGTSASFLDSESTDATFRADVPAGDAAAFAVVNDPSWDDDILVVKTGSDVVVVTVVSQGSDALELAFSRIVDEPASVYVSADRVRALGIDPATALVTVDGAPVPASIVTFGEEDWFRIDVGTFSTRYVAFRAPVDEPAPVEDDAETPTTGNESDTPVTGNESDTPTTGNESDAPTTSNESDAPTTDEPVDDAPTTNESDAPTTGNESEAPATGNESDAPTTGNESDAPTTEEPVDDAPTTGNESDAPTTGNETDAPPTEEPVDDSPTTNESESPATENETDAPPTEEPVGDTTTNESDTPTTEEPVDDTATAGDGSDGSSDVGPTDVARVAPVVAVHSQGAAVAGPGV